MGGLSFGQDADGNWGYKAGGADTVTPFKGDPDFDYEHGISIPYVVAAGNPNVLHYYTMTAEDAAYSYLALFAVTAGSVVSIELSGVSGPSIVCNKPGGSYSFALIANPVLNGKVNFRHGGTGDGHVYKLKDWVEPDISVICDHNKLTDRGCTGAPDWIVEIVSPSSRRMDYSIKNTIYSGAGVREYWIVDPAKQRTTVYHYEEDAAPMIYLFDQPVSAGIYTDLMICIADLLNN